MVILCEDNYTILRSLLFQRVNYDILSVYAELETMPVYWFFPLISLWGQMQFYQSQRIGFDCDHFFIPIVSLFSGLSSLNWVVLVLD